MIWIKVLMIERGESLNAKSKEAILFELEQAQKGLRDSIKRAKDLTEETARLVRENHVEMPKPQNPSR